MTSTVTTRLSLSCFAVSALALAIAVAGCQSKTEDGDVTPNPKAAAPAPATGGAADGTFASAQTVFSRCTGCHGENGKGQIDLRTVDSILKGGEDGPIVKPGDPANSALVQALRGQNGKRQMPPRGALPDADIAKVEAWIKAGAKA